MDKILRTHRISLMPGEFASFTLTRVMLKFFETFLGNKNVFSHICCIIYILYYLYSPEMLKNPDISAKLSFNFIHSLPQEIFITI